MNNKGKAYLDPSLPTDRRVADLLHRLTPEEKIGQLLQTDARHELEHNIVHRFVGSILHASPEQLYQAADFVAKTRMRIPLLIGDDLIHGYSFWPGATIFPTQLAMAATWNPELLERMARATAEEAAPTGIHWTFSPVLCIARDLRWGRVDETFGEDPYLIGELASAMVKGYQGGGSGSEHGKSLRGNSSLLATAKHFAGYSQTQGGRDASEADLTRRNLKSWFLPPFERVAREGCATFMLGYESIDGTPITVNRWILNDVLRGAWKYSGMLVTDWDNVGRLVWEQRLQPDIAHAAAAAIKAGNDMIMTTPSFFEGAMQALERKMISIEEIDAAASRVLAVKFNLGLFENPRLPRRDVIKTSIGTAQHQELNLEIARRSVVLLNNDGTLPLHCGDHVECAVHAEKHDDRDSFGEADTTAVRAASSKHPIQSIAVIGPLADDAQTQLGDWAGGSGQVPWLVGQPREMITTILDGLREQTPDDVKVTYAEGAGILSTVPEQVGEVLPDGQPAPPIAVPCKPDPKMIDEALHISAQADVSIVVVGDRIELVGEGRSTATLRLFGAQNALIDAIADQSRHNGKPFIIVLLASKPLILPESAQQAAALLWVGNPGMKGGQAIAEVLLGKIEPSGRLPISFAKDAGQLPIFYNQIRGQHGTRYADLDQKPEHAFGEGLSYTTVVYGDARIAAPQSKACDVNDTLTFAVTVSNTGNRPCLETVQLYIRDLVTSATWADKELKAFTQLHLEAGESRLVEISLPVSACSIVNTSGQRVVEPGDFEALIGHSSKDDDLTAVPFTVI
ncbi:MAG: glycoside hydrolase family 3 N-terminal domain-containing protein [Bifidobacterium aquikefiri]|uniref:beta-glucosidase n=1 Tax=Bifidobacterium aquikefiri TaxID=1653207 RepID=A0A261GAE7_9BIFI|nr:glycoside hydrolase family 3 N-terminal domain-containing protein [Bifidobacterium aquikefiri]OZG68388.1 beta-glucosidase [Bifidobacterium aquikefiri]